MLISLHKKGIKVKFYNNMFKTNVDIIEKYYNFSFKDFIEDRISKNFIYHYGKEFNLNTLLSKIFLEIFKNKKFEEIYDRYNFLLQIEFKTDFYNILYENEVVNIIMPKYKDIEVYFDEGEKRKYLIHLLFHKYNKEYKSIRIESKYAPILISKKTFNKNKIKDLYIDLFIHPKTDKNKIDLNKICFDKNSNIYLSRFKNICGTINNFSSLSINYAKIDENIFNKMNKIDVLKLNSITNITDILLKLNNKNICCLEIGDIYINDFHNLKTIPNIDLNIFQKLEIRNINIENLNLKNLKNLKIYNSNIKNLSLENIDNIEFRKTKINNLNLNTFYKLNFEYSHNTINNAIISFGKIANLRTIFINGRIEINNIENLYIQNNLGNELYLKEIDNLLFEYIVSVEYIKLIENLSKENKMQEILNKIVIEKTKKDNVKIKFLLFNDIYKNKNISNKFCIFNTIKNFYIKSKINNFNIELDIKNQDEFSDKTKNILFFSILENLYYLIQQKNDFITSINIKMPNNYNSLFDKDLYRSLFHLINLLNHNIEISKIKKEIKDILKNNIKLMLINKELTPGFYEKEVNKIAEKTSGKLIIV